MSTRPAGPWAGQRTGVARRCSARDMSRASRMIVRSGRLISGLEGNQPANGVNGKPRRSLVRRSEERRGGGEGMAGGGAGAGVDRVDIRWRARARGRAGAAVASEAEL